MDLKESILELQNNETFKHILATLLAIGNFLNGKKVRKARAAFKPSQYNFRWGGGRRGGLEKSAYYKIQLTKRETY